MLTDKERELMRDLSERIQQEKDNPKLVRLVEQLNSLLKKAERRMKSLREGLH
jgi:hypothetical protein